MLVWSALWISCSRLFTLFHRPDYFHQAQPHNSRASSFIPPSTPFVPWNALFRPRISHSWRILTILGAAPFVPGALGHPCSLQRFVSFRRGTLFIANLPMCYSLVQLSSSTLQILHRTTVVRQVDALYTTLSPI